MRTKQLIDSDDPYLTGEEYSSRHFTFIGYPHGKTNVYYVRAGGPLSPDGVKRVLSRYYPTLEQVQKLVIPPPHPDAAAVVATVLHPNPEKAYGIMASAHNRKRWFSSVGGAEDGTETSAYHFLIWAFEGEISEGSVSGWYGRKRGVWEYIDPDTDFKG